MLGRCSAVLVGVLAFSGCVRGGPLRSMDAGSGGTDAQVADAGPAIVDSGVPPIDAPSGVDAYVPTPTDAGVDAYVPPPVDGGPTPGTRQYLDRCTTGADCASTQCAVDLGGTRFCTRSCTVDAQCADEHVCVSGTCVPDDTGEPCNTATPATCATGLCLGVGTNAQCVRDCGGAADCPAGYACTTFDASGRRVCIDIEQPCNTAADCRTGTCITGIGCTGSCRSAADCPGRLAVPELASFPYRCGTAPGVTGTICLPPDDVVGDDPIGAFCASSGTVFCRSGLCASEAIPTAMCTQGCGAEGNCPPGYGCVPDVYGGAIALACQRAGTRDLGQSCASARECESALCLDPGYCTRLCMDGICPTGWTCTPFAAGSSVALCVRP